MSYEDHTRYCQPISSLSGDEIPTLANCRLKEITPFNRVTGELAPVLCL